MRYLTIHDEHLDPSVGCVLVVDDNRLNRYMLGQRVQTMGCEVHHACDGREALEQLHLRNFDLVLLDIDMPELDGFAVLETMKDSERLREVPVVVISGVNDIKSVARCIERGAEDYLTKPFELILLRARVWASLEKKRLRDEEKRKTDELGRALNQLKAAQQQIIAHEKLASLGALTAGIAHEIKNPLNLVTNFAHLSKELLDELYEERGRDAKPDDMILDLRTDDRLDKLRNNVRKINEHGKRADAIIRSMLLHAGGKPGQPQESDVNALVKQAAHLAYHSLRAKDETTHYTLEESYDASVGMMEVVPQDLSRALVNVMTNAFEAAQHWAAVAENQVGPRVEFKTKNLGAAIEIRIRDNGAGIPPNIRPHIFKPFFTTKIAGKGAGLGLSITYDILVQQHRASIEVNSPGGGTEFIIRLPKRSDAQNGN